MHGPRDAAREIAVSTLNRAAAPLGRARLRRTLAATPRPWKVHVGAGGRRLDGWIDTDAHWRSPLHLDMARRWPVPDGSVSHVYADNVIEHLPLEAGRAFLAEVRRVLTDDGRLRLVTPDAERLTAAYLDDTAFADFVAHHRALGIDVAHRSDMLRIPYTSYGHWAGYLYDAASLRTELERAGFRVEDRRLGESDDPALAGLELRTGEWATAIQVAVEAMREPSPPR